MVDRTTTNLRKSPGVWNFRVKKTYRKLDFCSKKLLANLKNLALNFHPRSSESWHTNCILVSLLLQSPGEISKINGFFSSKISLADWLIKSLECFQCLFSVKIFRKRENVGEYYMESMECIQRQRNNVWNGITYLCLISPPREHESSNCKSVYDFNRTVFFAMIFSIRSWWNFKKQNLFSLANQNYRRISLCFTKYISLWNVIFLFLLWFAYGRKTMIIFHLNCQNSKYIFFFLWYIQTLNGEFT